MEVLREAFCCDSGTDALDTSRVEAHGRERQSIWLIGWWGRHDFKKTNQDVSTMNEA
jgi:hypothetical protein